MLLNCKQIRDLGLIAENLDDTRLKTSSYDLRVDKLIGRKETGRAFTTDDYLLIQPMGMVTVISKEMIRLPADVTAYAMVKTSLCRKGILAINIGIFDPGWYGPASTILLNFGKEPYQIRRDDAFLRLTFHRSEACCEVKPSGDERAVYEAKLHKAYQGKFGATFMNVEEAASKARNKLELDLRTALFKYLPLAALLLTLLTFFLNYGVLTIASRAMPMDEVDLRERGMMVDLRQQLERLQSENEAMRKELDALKKK
jgi:deoxycytidine triphosphate deaminase